MELLVIGCMLMLSAYFSGMEMAFFRANRFRIELLSNQGDRTGRILSGYLHNTSRFIATILIANNLALVIYGRASGQFIESHLIGWLEWDNIEASSLLLVQTLLSTIVVLVLGEYLPKALVTNFPLALLRRTTWFMELFYQALKPVVWLADRFTRLVLRRVLHVANVEETLVFSKRDLHTYIMETIQQVPEQSNALDAETFSKALDFNQVKVREFMVPRTEIIALPSSANLDELRELFIETELSRIVIYDDTLDHVRGYVHTRSLFTNPSNLSEVIQRVMFVPESMSANILLSEFNNRRKSMAIVVDEFGGTAGLVTIEDLVETVFGDIDDEHDEEDDDEWIEEVLGPNEYRLSGRLEIDYLNETYHLGLPEGEYSTLSGLIMQAVERIPNEGEVIFTPGFKLTIQVATRNKIETVHLEKQPHHE